MSSSTQDKQEPNDQSDDSAKPESGAVTVDGDKVTVPADEAEDDAAKPAPIDMPQAEEDDEVHPEYPDLETPANDQPAPDQAEDDQEDKIIDTTPKVSVTFTPQEPEQAPAEQADTAIPFELPRGPGPLKLAPIAQEDLPAPIAAETAEPEDDVLVLENEITEDAAPKAKRNWLSIAFNAASSMAVGAGASFAFKTAIAGTALAASPFFVIAGGAALSTALAVTAFRRWRDVANYKKANDDAEGAKFFKPSTTGHKSGRYMNTFSFSLVFATIGGCIGYSLSGGETAPQIIDVPDPGPEVVTTPEPIIDQVERTAEELLPTSGGESVPTVPAPVLVTDTPLTALETALSTGHLPTQLTPTLADTLTRLDSVDPIAQAQAIKDLGHFAANGLEGFTKDTDLAHQLFQQAYELSGGTNMQAAHSLGYDFLHGIGTDANAEQAFQYLTEANDSGHPLAQPMLDYMSKMGMSPA